METVKSSETAFNSREGPNIKHCRVQATGIPGGVHH